MTQQEATKIIEDYYGVKVVDYYNKKIHNMTLQLKGSFIVEGSNFSTLAFNPGAKQVLVEITTEKLQMLKDEMES